MSKNSSADEDVSFSALGIFFLSDTLVYEINKMQHLPINQEAEECLIKHLLTFNGCKLLITSYLFQIIKNVFFSMKKK